jgi:TP901 family phage tail tape measure protein
LADLAQLEIRIQSADAKVAAQNLADLEASAKHLDSTARSLQSALAPMQRTLAALSRLQLNAGKIDALATAAAALGPAASRATAPLAALTAGLTALNTAVAGIGQLRLNLTGLGLTNIEGKVKGLQAIGPAITGLAQQAAAANPALTALNNNLGALVVNLAALNRTRTGNIGLGRLTTDLSASTRTAVKGTNDLSQAINNVNASVTKFRILGSLLAAGFIATRVANRALIDTLGKFEQNLASLRGVAIDATASLKTQEDQFNKLEQAARNIGQTTRFTAVEASEGLLVLAKAGISVEESIEVLPSVLALAQGQLIEVSAAAETVTSVLRQFGIDTLNASRVVDVLSETANLSATDVQNLAESFKFVGPVAAALGRDLEEISAALGVLANSGIKGSLAGTTLRGVLTALADPTDVAKERIRDLGLSLDELDPSVSSLESILTSFSSTFVSTADAVDIFNRRNAATFLILQDNLGPLNDFQQALEKARGETLRLARLQDDTLLGAFKRFRAILQDNILNLTGFQGALRTTTEFFTDTLKVLADVDDDLAKSNDSAVAFAKVLEFLGSKAVTTAGALVLISTAIIAIGAEVKLATVGLTGFNATLAATRALLVGHPILLIAGGIAAATLAVKAFTPEITSAAEEIAKFGDPGTRQQFEQFIKQIRDFDAKIELKIDEGESDAALELMQARLLTIETIIDELKLELIKNPQEAVKPLEDVQKLLKDIGQTPLFEELVTERQKNVLKDSITKTLSEAVVAGVESSGTAFSKLGALLATLGQPGTERFEDIFTGGLIQVTDEDARRIQVQINKLIRDTRSELQAGISNPPIREALAGNLQLDDTQTAQLREAVSGLVAEFVDSSRLLQVNISDVLPFIQEQFQLSTEEAEEFKKKLEAINTVPGLTPEQIQLRSELIEKIADNKEAINELVQSLEDEISTNQQLFGIKEADRAFTERRIEAERLLADALSASLQANELDKIELIARIAKQKEAGVVTEEEVKNLANLERRLIGASEAEKRLAQEHVNRSEAVRLLIEIMREQTRAEEDANTRSEAAAKARDSLLSQAVQSEKAFQQALDERLLATGQISEVEVRLREVERNLVGDTQLRKLSNEGLAESIEANVRLQLQEETALEQLNDEKREAIKLNKEQQSSLERLIRDLELEREAIGKSNVEREVLSRQRRLSITLTDEEESALKTIIQSLDQSARAEQLGRDIGGAFTGAIKDVLIRGADLEETAKNLLLRIGEIFLDATVFKPLEDALARAFGKSTGAQRITAGKDFVDTSEVEAAFATLRERLLGLEVEGDSLAAASVQLEKANLIGLDFANRLLLAAQALQQALAAGATAQRLPPISGGVIPGVSPPGGGPFVPEQTQALEESSEALSAFSQGLREQLAVIEGNKAKLGIGVQAPESVGELPTSLSLVGLQLEAIEDAIRRLPDIPLETRQPDLDLPAIRNQAAIISKEISRAVEASAPAPASLNLPVVRAQAEQLAKEVQFSKQAPGLDLPRVRAQAKEFSRELEPIFERTREETQPPRLELPRELPVISPDLRRSIRELESAVESIPREQIRSEVRSPIKRQLEQQSVELRKIQDDTEDQTRAIRKFPTPQLELDEDFLQRQGRRPLPEGPQIPPRLAFQGIPFSELQQALQGAPGGLQTAGLTPAQLNQLRAASVQLNRSGLVLTEAGQTLSQAGQEQIQAAQTTQIKKQEAPEIEGPNLNSSFFGNFFENIFGQVFQQLISGIKFAQGGVFTNRIVSSPTVAPLALFGEAGPEAIVPLERTRNGLAASAFFNRKEIGGLPVVRGPGGKLGVDLKGLLSPLLEFQDGGLFPLGLERFQAGGVVGGQIRSAPIIVQAEGGGSSQAVSISVRNEFKFGPGTRPDQGFRKAARQFEADLKDRTRRVL